MPEPVRLNTAFGSEIDPVAVAEPEIVPLAPRSFTKPLAMPTGSWRRSTLMSSIWPTVPAADSEPLPMVTLARWIVAVPAP